MGIIIFLVCVAGIALGFSLHRNLRTKVERQCKAKFLKTVPMRYSSKCEKQGHVVRLDYETHDYLPGGNEKKVIKKYLQVYLPYDYSEDNQYNIIYLMHGMGGDAQTWLGTDEDPSMGKNYLDHLIEDEKIPPVIVVTPSYYQGKEAYETDDYDSSLTKCFGKELENDVMPLVESKYSTYAQRPDKDGFESSREHRAFAGFSMGAVTTWYRMIDSMRYFKYYMPFSGSLYWGVEALGSDDGEWDASQLTKAIKEHGYSSDDYYVYYAVGSLDYARENVDPSLKSMLDFPKYFKFGRPDDKDVNITFGVALYEYHTPSCRNRCLYNALPIIMKKMQAEE